MQQYVQLISICPNCRTETNLICYNENPVIYKCQNCSNFVVINGDKAFNIGIDFMEQMITKYNFKMCGQIIRSESSNKIITEDDVKDLHEFLDENENFDDIIDKL